MHVGGVKCAADELSLCGGVWKVTGKSTQADGWLGFSGDEGGNIPPLESCQQESAAEKFLSGGVSKYQSFIRSEKFQFFLQKTL